MDLQYHDVNRERGLFYKLQDRGMVERMCTDADIDDAIDTPPQTTRARLRGEFIRRAKERKRDYTVDWVHLKLNDQAQRTVLCKDPFKSPRRAGREAHRLALSGASARCQLRHRRRRVRPRRAAGPAARRPRRRQPGRTSSPASPGRWRSGDEVVVNTTAVELGLGTGGWHVVHWNLAGDEWHEPGPGHIMKLRYTSLQADTGAAEEHGDRRWPWPDLDGLPVVACGLHSQVGDRRPRSSRTLEPGGPRAPT